MSKYVLMPETLTAENGAKGLLIGEFSEQIRVDCPECYGEGIDDDGEQCIDCFGSGGEQVKVPVQWSTIKEIYAMAVKHLAK